MLKTMFLVLALSIIVAVLVRIMSESLLNEYERRLEALLDRIECKTCDCNTSKERPRDCDDILQLGLGTGVYIIYPDGKTKVSVRCDMDTASGGWTVFQRRVSASNFYKTWEEYRKGFGNLENNFWLGNDNIHMISSKGSYELRIDMSNDQNEKRYAAYVFFEIADVQDKFRLFVGSYNGDAGDSLTYHNGQPFTTKDVDNDSDRKNNCAVQNVGGWWYNACHKANPNGLYDSTVFGKGINWVEWEGYDVSLQTVEMKIRKSRN